MPTMYLLNSAVLTEHGTFRFGGITEATAKKLVADAGDAVVSAIGHAPCARMLAAILGHRVEVDRRRVAMQPGDRAVVLRVLVRLPEGSALGEAEFRAVPHELGLLERIE